MDVTTKSGEATTPGVTRVKIEGYRSLRRVELEPERITVLIGANGSGKSNVLSALRMVPLIRTHSLRTLVAGSGGASALLHYGPRRTPQLALRVEMLDDKCAHNAYEARLGHAAADTLIFLDEVVEHCPAGGGTPQVYSLGAGHQESRLSDEAQEARAPTVRAVNWWLSRMSFFHFHDTSVTSPLRQNARQEDTRYLRSDGSNLAAYLYSLANAEGAAHQKAWRRINDFVRRIAPFVKTLDPAPVDPSQGERSAIRLDWTDESDHVFGPHHLSDGTLRAIALITALAQPAESLPRFVSIDEPELGLHPVALAIFASLVRSVSMQCQVLLATQSPALLDHFEPEEVVVAERVAGETELRRLDSDDLAAWLEEYCLSDLYDKNVLGGRP
jgi:predicted ATPase